MRFTAEKAEEFENKLLKRGYRKYFESYHSEDYVLWKNIKDANGEVKYSIGFGFYDWSKYPQYIEKETISVSFNFLLGSDTRIGRMDINISDNNLTDKQFEKFCEEFYTFFNNQTSIKHEN